MFIPHLNRKFSGGQLHPKGMTIDIGHTTCLMKYITNCGRLCGTYIYFFILFFSFFFPTHSFLLFAKLLNFFTKSGSFGREGLWYSNFLQSFPFLCRGLIQRRTHLPQVFPFYPEWSDFHKQEDFFLGEGEWGDFFFKP